MIVLFPSIPTFYSVLSVYMTVTSIIAICLNYVLTKYLVIIMGEF